MIFMKKYLIPIIVIILNVSSAFSQTTFTSIQDGDWNDCTTWNGSPCTSTEGVTFPSRTDNVIIDHDIMINAVDDNNSGGGATPSSITGVCDISNFNNCTRNAFYHDGFVNIGSTGTLTSDVSLILGNGATVNGGSLIVQGNVNNDIFSLGELDILNSATLEIIDNLVLTLDAISNVDETSTANIGDDLIVDGDNAFICGLGTYSIDRTTGGSNAGNNSLIHISNDDPSVFLDQICAEVTIVCEDGNCASGLSNDGDIAGVAGPGDGVLSPSDAADPDDPDNNRPSSSGVLPVELIGFDARIQNGEVLITWVTASEENNDFFTIERSQDGQEWEEISAIEGAGTTSIKQEYQSVDVFPLPGLSFYRLKQTDFNGDFTYSDLVLVENELAQFIVLGPNPTSNLIRVNTQSSIIIENISIVDLAGKRLDIQVNNQASNAFSIDLLEYVNKNGVYLINVLTNAGSIQERVIFQGR